MKKSEIKKVPLKKVVRKKATTKEVKTKNSDHIKKDSVKKILRSFKNNLHSIKFFFNKFGGIAEDEDEGAIKSAKEFTDELINALDIAIDKTKEKKQEKSKISEDKLLEVLRKLKKRPKLSAQNFQILSSSSFLMLNNYFEYLIGDLLTYHYSKYKDQLNSKEFKISLQEINEYGSVQELEKHLIFKEVETMLIEMSFDSLIKHFQKKFNIELNDGIVNWEVINECRERRHIIVHNASIVNKKYLSRTNNPEKKKVGDKLRVSKEYFQHVFKEIKLAGLLLSYDCWGKWDSKQATDAIGDMLIESFDSLSENENDFCYKITSYIQKIEPRGEKQEDLLMRAKFNMCISLKCLNKSTELKETLKTIKIGTAAPIFKLAHAILSNKNDKIILELFQQSYKLKEIDYDAYEEWPIFKLIKHKKRLNNQIEKVLNN